MSEYVIQDIHAHLEDDKKPRPEVVSARLRDVILAHDLSQERRPVRSVELFSRTAGTAASLMLSLLRRTNPHNNLGSNIEAFLIFNQRTTIPNLVGYCMLANNTNIRELGRRDTLEHTVGPTVDIASVVLADGDDEKFREINELIIEELKGPNPMVALEPVTSPEMIQKSLKDVYGDPIIGGFSRGNNNKVIQTAAFGLTDLIR